MELDVSKTIPDPTKLTQNEYRGLWAMVGALDTLLKHDSTVEKRCKRVDGTWQNLKQAEELLKEAFEKLLTTVPDEGKLNLREQMKNTVTVTYTVTPTLPGPKITNTVYMDENVYLRMADRAMAAQCFYCEKTGKEAKKCPLFRDLHDSVHFDIPLVKNEPCPFSECLSYPKE